MNLLHPLYHSYSYHIGSRIGIKEKLPAALKKTDFDDLIERLSSPPEFQERIAPISVQLGKELVQGKNYTDMIIRCYRIFLEMFSRATAYIRQTMTDNFSENNMVPFLSLTIDPDTLHRIIETDYDVAENTYGKINELYTTGVMAPALTVPFHLILPMLPSEFDIRLCVRIGLLFYWNMLKEYHRYLFKEIKEDQFVVNFWLPEGAYNKQVAEIILEEFNRKCSSDRIKNAHLVILLDNQQSLEGGNDVRMKSWNIAQFDAKKKTASVVFKDRGFSDWVSRANPSVKKLLDRTIAKVDADLNEQEIDYCWSHFESFESLAFTPKAVANFEQKIIKLTELGYLALAPDMFIRRKISKSFQSAKHEPFIASLKDNSAAYDWHLENASLGRWEGTLDSNSPHKIVDENRPYARNVERGTRQEKGSQCWKLALLRAINTCADAVKGDPNNFSNGMLETLASLVPSKSKKIVKRNVQDFLVYYSYVYWTEHFLQQGYSEADLQLSDVVKTYLFRGCKGKPSNEKIIIAGVAARAYYFALDSARSFATSYENFDQRAVYQNVVMVTLSMIYAIHAYHWRKQTGKAKLLVSLLKRELIAFENAFSRYKLPKYGVTEAEWNDAIKSQIKSSKLNVVERAARRIAASHLRPLGYTKDFLAEDEKIPTSTGHIWSEEIVNPNFQWENVLFCGLKED